MNKVLALTIGDRVTYCSEPENQEVFNYVTHQVNGEREAQFCERISKTTIMKKHKNK